MKKILSTAAAFTLVAGLATSAMAADAPAADKFNVKGTYSLVGAYQSDGNGAGNGVQLQGVSGTENGDDSFWFHSFTTTATYNVNDKITMVSELRFADRDVWGYSGLPNTTGSHAAGAADTGATTYYNGGTVANDGDNGIDQGRQIDVRKIYMEYMSPIGKWRMGRVPTAAWGGLFIDNNSQGNRLMWWPTISGFPAKPWSILLFTQKITEADVLNTSDDADSDAYYFGIDHKVDMGVSQLAYWHVRNATANTPGVDDVATRQDIWYYGKYDVKSLNLTIEGELDWIFGDNTATVDNDALAAQIDVSARFGGLTVGGLYFYLSGDSNNTDDEQESAMNILGGSGDDYNPFLILTGDYTGILNTDKAGGGSSPFTANRIDRAGVNAFGVKAAYQVTPKFSVNGIVGTAWADEEQFAGQDDSYGVEYNLNAAYKLLDNLTYGVHFGYLDTGDYFKTTANNVHTAPTNEITFVANGITMSF